MNPSASTSGAGEEWRTVPGSSGLYSVSNLGRVRSERVEGFRPGRQRGRVLKCYRDTKGYLQFRICRLDGKQTTTKVHRAVALAFLGSRPAGAQINHESGDKLDNSVGNLEYVSCRQNIRHGWSNGLYSANHARGEKNAVAKLTAEVVQQIRGLSATTSLTDLAARFGVTKQNIWQIVNRKTWRHVA